MKYGINVEMNVRHVGEEWYRRRKMKGVSCHYRAHRICPKINKKWPLH
jgi:hypothetical protein